MRRVLALAVAGALAFAAPAWADREHSTNNTSKKLRQAVTVPGILEHENAFQDIAEFTGGNRLSGAPGYDASAQYVAERAEAAGLEVSTQEFDYELDLLADYTPPVLSIVSGGPARAFVPGIGGTLFSDGDFGSMYASPSGDLTRPVWAADIDLDPATAASNTSGCQAADYAGMPQGAIVLLQAGTSCSLGTKFFGAQQFGAGAIVFFNAQGGTWINVTGISIPSVAAQAGVGSRAGQRRREGQHRTDRPLEGRLAAGDLPDVERHRGDARRRSGQRHRRGRAPRQRRRGPGHQRQRVRLGDDPRDRGAAAQGQAAQQDPLHLVRRRGARPARFGGLCRQPAAVRARQDRGDAELRHGRLAELRALRVRRGPVGLRAARGRGASGLGGDRGALPRLLREPGARDGADGVRRPVGLRAVHLRRHPGRRPLHRRRGDQDRGAGRDLRRHGRGAV